MNKIGGFKNKWIALLLSILGLIFTPLTGLGNAYLGLYKRYIIEAIIAMVLNAIPVYYLLSNMDMNIITIFTAIYLIWMFYCIYDTYKCYEAISEYQEIPKLFGIDIQ